MQERQGGNQDEPVGHGGARKESPPLGWDAFIPLHMLRWRPTSKEELLAAERALLALISSPYEILQVKLRPVSAGSVESRTSVAGPGQPRIINTVIIEHQGQMVKQGPTSAQAHTRTLEGVTAGTQGTPAVPTLVLLHGFGGSQGFYFRNFDFLAKHFRVMAIDQLGWGASSRPEFRCQTRQEAEEWFVGALEEWREAMGLSRMLLLGHSFGAYVASRYALQYPDRVERLILAGPAGFAPESLQMASLRSTWRGALLDLLWQRNFTPFALVRALGRWGPPLVQTYTKNRFGVNAQGLPLSEKEAPLFSEYLYHTLAAIPSGELCMRHLFSLGAFAKAPLLQNAPNWKVPTTFIYGCGDIMDYRAGVAAANQMPVPAQLFRIPKGGHFVFLDNAPAFHLAVLEACKGIIPTFALGDAFDCPLGGPIPVSVQKGEGANNGNASCLEEKEFPGGGKEQEKFIKFSQTWRVG